MTRVLPVLALIACALLCLSVARLQAQSPEPVVFTQSSFSVAVFDFVEIAAAVKTPAVPNPFTDVSFTGEFEQAGSHEQVAVEGFCDSADGSVYRIRFMPAKAGDYTFHLTLKAGALTERYAGRFTAVDEHRRGPLRVDPAYPWHFIYEGTGEHYFFNGTTAYWLLGWRDESTIQYSIARLARLKVNRMRVAIAGRSSTFYGEPAMIGARWTYFLEPWPAAHATDFRRPEFDYARFNVAYWQKFERMVRYAREKGVVISLVLDMNDSGVHPQAGSEDEHRFIRYAAARFGSFANITWDLGDDLDSFRDEKWAHETGTLLEQWDTYHHLATSHPVNIEHQDRASNWFGFTSYQEWSRNQHPLMLESRKLQEKAGRIIPQTNEEYGYEDHYPEWAAAGSESADVLRRTAWDIYMAGGYQTAGESVRRGTNIWPDTGGGWMNGRGDDTMTMFLGYGHMVDFFTGFEWWKTEPHDELVDNGNYCLAQPGKIYAVYLPAAGKATVKLEPGRYAAFWFGAVTGEKIALPDAEGSTWTSPEAPDRDDWTLLLLRSSM
jgi:hypothetical protein